MEAYQGTNVLFIVCDDLNRAVASTSAGCARLLLAPVKQTSEVWDCVETTVETGTDAGCLGAKPV